MSPSYHRKMTGMLLVLLTVLVTPAHAFNAVILYDPDFRHYMFRTVPWCLAIATALWVSVLFFKAVRGYGVSFLRLLGIMVVSHVLAVYMNLALFTVMGSLFFKALTEPQHWLVPWVAKIYFFWLFAYVAWWLTLLGMEKTLKGRAGAWALLRKGFRLPVFCAIIPPYAAAYWHILNAISG